jgi:hypothetical protein
MLFKRTTANILQTTYNRNLGLNTGYFFRHVLRQRQRLILTKLLRKSKVN